MTHPKIVDAVLRLKKRELEVLVIAIFNQLDKEEWDSSTATNIANIMTETGLPEPREP